jgi:hypothetical protein
MFQTAPVLAHGPGRTLERYERVNNDLGWDSRDRAQTAGMFAHFQPSRKAGVRWPAAGGCRAKVADSRKKA